MADPVVPILVALAVVVATVLYFLTRGGKKADVPQEVAPRLVPVRAPVVAGRPRVRGVARLRQAEAANQESGSEDSDDEGEGDETSHKKIGTKKAAKLERKQQAREDREAMLALKAERKAEAERRAEKEDEARAAEEAAELALQQELQKQEEERKKKEQAEYEEARAAFVVEEGGSAADQEAAESQSMLAEFVNFIKTKKVVMVEELASHFKLKTKDAISRLQALEQMGTLTGFMDDRGKYIYVSREELASAAKWIKQRGRVSIAELSENSNSLVRLSE